MVNPPTTVRPDRMRPADRPVDRPTRSDVTIAQPEAISAHPARRAVTARRLSLASAALLLVGGYVHLCLYRHGYRFIPKIGVSFLAQAASSAVLAAALLVKGGRIHVGRRSFAVAQLTRLSAIGLSVGTLAALGIAHTPGGLFQFREIGLRPAPQTLIAIGAESLATLLLGVAMVQGLRTAPSQTVIAATESPSRPASRDAA
jgi:hypothetical protein